MTYPSPKPDEAFKDIIKEVCLTFNVPQQALFSSLRTDEVAMARFAAMWLLKHRVPTLSDRRIAGYFGKERSTVSHGIQVARNTHDVNTHFRNKIEIIKTKLKEE